jgi:hypothetical protein
MRIRNSSRTRRGLSGFGDLGSDAIAALATVSPIVTIQTSVTPEIPINLTGTPGAGVGANSGGALVNFLQPTVRFYAADGQTVLATIAPNGVPSGISSAVGTWAAVAGLLLAGLIGLGYMVGKNNA